MMSMLFIPALREILEIILISTLIYYYLLWIAYDQTTKLLYYVYGYCLTLMVSYYTNCLLFHSFLWICLPFFILFSIIIHQHILQKNFVSLAKLAPKQSEYQNNDILEILIRSALVAINNGQEAIYIIENQSDINSYLKNEFPLHAQIQPRIFNLVFESSCFDQTKMIWIHNPQKLAVGFNVNWSFCQTDENITTASWQENSILITQKTDCFVLKADSLNRSFTLVIKGQIKNNITANSVMTCMNDILKEETIIYGKKSQTRFVSK